MPRRLLVDVVVATAAGTSLVIAGLFFFYKKFRRCYKRDELESSFRREAVVDLNNQGEFEKLYSRGMKGNGRKVRTSKVEDDAQVKTTFPKIIFNASFELEEERKLENNVEEEEELGEDKTQEPQNAPEASPSPPPPPEPLEPQGIDNRRSRLAPPFLPPLRPLPPTLMNKSPTRAVLENSRSRAGASTGDWGETGFGRMKLKPLHWDKVNASAADH